MRRKIEDKDIEESVKNSLSIRQALLKLGLAGKGGNYVVFKRRVERLRLDTSHFKGQGYLRGKKHNWAPRRPLIEILTRNSSYTNTNKLRERLLRESIFEYKCAICSNSSWLGCKIPLELDHIDGDRSNNSLGNLRLLCPNCHATTSTYRGRNIKGRVAERQTQGTLKKRECPGGNSGSRIPQSRGKLRPKGYANPEPNLIRGRCRD